MPFDCDVAGKNMPSYVDETCVIHGGPVCRRKSTKDHGAEKVIAYCTPSSVSGKAMEKHYKFPWLDELVVTEYHPIDNKGRLIPSK